MPALNGTEELGAGQSIQKTYDLTRYLEHQLRTLAGTYVSRGLTPPPACPSPISLLAPQAWGPPAFFCVPTSMGTLQTSPWCSIGTGVGVHLYA